MCGLSRINAPTVNGELTPHGPIALWRTFDAGTTWVRFDAPEIANSIDPELLLGTQTFLVPGRRVGAQRQRRQRPERGRRAHPSSVAHRAQRSPAARRLFQ